MTGHSQSSLKNHAETEQVHIKTRSEATTATIKDVENIRRTSHVSFFCLELFLNSNLHRRNHVSSAHIFYLYSTGIRKWKVKDVYVTDFSGSLQIFFPSSN